MGVFPESAHTRNIGETLRKDFLITCPPSRLSSKPTPDVLLSAMAGPAQAGVFYIRLRLSETLSNVGATATETSVAALSSLPADQRRASFQQAWKWTGLFCLHGAIVLVFLSQDFWRVWVPEFSDLSSRVWPFLAAYGLAGAWSQMTENASMGMNQIRSASKVALGETALTLVLAPAGFTLAGFPGLFAGGSAAAFATWMQARRLARIHHISFFNLWIQPLTSLLPGLMLGGLLVGWVSRFHLLWLDSLVILVPAGLILWGIKKSCGPEGSR